MGETINNLIDNLSAALWRVYQLPFSFLVLLFILVLFFSYFLLILCVRKSLKHIIRFNSSFIFILATILFSALLIDKKFDVLNEHLYSIEQYNNAFISSLTPIQLNGNNVDSTTNILPQLKSHLKINDLPPAIIEIPVVEGASLAKLVFSKPNAIVYIVKAKLNCFDVILDSSVLRKSLTSAFAMKFGCQFAINGEAGNSPGKEAPLGEWIGNYYVNGKVIYNNDNDVHPFISFDKNNRGKYYKGVIVDTIYSTDKYNTIWGRWDLLLNGKITIDKRDRTQYIPYPRTIIGLDKSGENVFLMVVDGRKPGPGNSMGLSMENCAIILQEAGCYNAMACDQGGSSCMYAKGKGIINSPADGLERATYTHFGLKAHQ